MNNEFGDLDEEYGYYDYDGFCDFCGENYNRCGCYDDGGCEYCGQYKCQCKCERCSKIAFKCQCRAGPKFSGGNVLQREILENSGSGNTYSRESENGDSHGSTEKENSIQEKIETDSIPESQDQINPGSRDTKTEVSSSETKETILTESTPEVKSEPEPRKRDPVGDFSRAINGDSKKIKPRDRYCSHCKKNGHDEAGCWALVPCKSCGKVGHPIYKCTDRSKAKKDKGQGTRNTKTNDLIGKSQSLEEEKIKANEDGLKQVIEDLKDELLDIKEVNEMEEDEEKEINKKKEEKARYEQRFSSRKRNQKERINDMYTEQEKRTMIDEDGRAIEDITDDPSGGVDVMMPRPSPSEVDDEYDEDPRSYTFTSPISWPSLSMWYEFFSTTVSWEVLTFLVSYLIIFIILMFIFMPAFMHIFLVLISPFAPHLLASGWFVMWLLILTSSTAGMSIFIGVTRLSYRIFKNIFLMVRWKNTYTFINYLDSDKVDLRTDNQKRSIGEFTHEDAVYARYRYSRRLHISYTENYKDTGPLTAFMSRWLAWSLVAMGKYIPHWLVEFDKEYVVSLEALDQVKDFSNMDFGSTDLVASDKIKVALKRVGTIWVSRHLKTDPLYTTAFLAWAYFKHNQQRTMALPFYRAPLNLT